MFKLSDEGALKEIKKLINLDIIKREGKGKALHYIIKYSWRFDVIIYFLRIFSIIDNLYIF